MSEDERWDAILAILFGDDPESAWHAGRSVQSPTTRTEEPTDAEDTEVA